MNNENVLDAVKFFGNLGLDYLWGNNVICWVAGGAVRDYFSLGHITSDIDIFFPNEHEFKNAQSALADLDYKPTFENERVVNYQINNLKFQLVKIRWFESPINTIDQFDFTVCCGAVDENGVYLHETFLVDLARKRLIINILPFPISTMQRVIKYVRKGYTICNGNLLTLSKGISTVNFNNPQENNIEFYSDGTPKFVRWD